jgi:hypothetical protein
MASHAISAARRDDDAAKLLAGRSRSTKSFAIRASRTLFGKQSVAKERLFALAIERMATEQLDTKSTLAILTEVGLVNFARGLDVGSSPSRSLTSTEIARMASFLDTFMRRYPRNPVVSPTDFNRPATLVLVHKSQDGQAKAVVLSDDLERIYRAARAVRGHDRANRKRFENARDRPY